MAADPANARAMLPEFHGYFEPLVTKQEEAEADINHLGIVMAQEVADSEATLLYVLWGLSGFVLVTVITMLLLTARRTTRGLRHTATSLESVARGEFEIAHTVEGHDEFAAMDRSVIATLEYLQSRGVASPPIDDPLVTAGRRIALATVAVAQVLVDDEDEGRVDAIAVHHVAPHRGAHAVADRHVEVELTLREVARQGDDLEVTGQPRGGVLVGISQRNGGEAADGGDHGRGPEVLLGREPRQLGGVVRSCPDCRRSTKLRTSGPRGAHPAPSSASAMPRRPREMSGRRRIEAVVVVMAASAATPRVLPRREASAPGWTRGGLPDDNDGDRRRRSSQVVGVWPDP